MNEKLTIKEIITSAIDEMQRAQDTIKALYESLGEPMGSNESITDDEMLIEDMSNSVERLSTEIATIENAILIALNAAVSGNIESDGKGYTTSKLSPKEISFKETLEDIYDASNMYGINVDALSDDEIIELYDDVQEILANDDMYSDIYNDAVNTALKNFKDK